MVNWTDRAATSSQEWALSTVPTRPQTQYQLTRIPGAHKHINRDGSNEQCTVINQIKDLTVEYNKKIMNSLKKEKSTTVP